THLGGREVNVAILFTDLRDFTPLSEKCSPREVVEILNEYFTLVVEAVHTHHGVLDKFIGDAAMAVFGLDGKSAHENAILSAFDIQAGLITLNQKLTAQDRPNISNGIGIHCGPVVAGNIGSEERLEYTVIGDAVNTAARLESLTKELPSTLAVSETLYMQSSSQTQNQLIYLQDYALKGKADKIAVYGLPAIN
ncbi:MAG: adenylate/guanylate cyclase domain-containing protein, partial [Candidatus Latescibacteria bacterium]|nr:adenylate/guanylate cyclase domain-containing protein [Candidatus Latescibacterota bacterium]